MDDTADEVRASVDPLDAMRAAPDYHSVLLENDLVRVLDTRLGPGERTPIHTHQWPAALYVPSWRDFVRRDPDGNVLVDSRSMHAPPAIGAATWLPPLIPHRVINVGDGQLHIIAIELKQP
jgi:quercetin dioxygenase-like cupin family protein